MEVLIGFGILMVISFIAIIISVVVKKNYKITKEYSWLYTNILALNSKTEFNYITNTKLQFNPVLKSKRSLEIFNISQFITNEIESRKSYYSSLFNKIDENISLYNEYCCKYNNLKKYTSIEEFSKFKDIKIGYKTFIRCEKRLYNSLKLKEPVMEISAQCHATYTSPSGRNHYWKDENFSFNQLKQFLRRIELNEEQKIRSELITRLEKQKREKEKQEKIELQKRKKEEQRIKEQQRKENYKRNLLEMKEDYANKKLELEKKIKELNQRETKLALKEQEINKKENEFYEATKEHIYTTSPIEIKSEKIESYENLSITQKLKLLRSKFDSGEITYEEYNIKRKELL